MQRLPPECIPEDLLHGSFGLSRPLFDLDQIWPASSQEELICFVVR